MSESYFPGFFHGLCAGMMFLLLLKILFRK